MTALPQRPADVANDATLAELVHVRARHLLAVTAARAAGRPADPGHAPAALAIGQAITADVAAERTVIARDALAHGAGPGAVAAALGLPPAAEPIESEPRRVRPPHDTADPTFEHLHATSADAWRVAVRLDRVAALREPLAGVPVSDYEHRLVEWLAAFDVPTVAVFVALLHRARAAAPLPVGGAL